MSTVNQQSRSSGLTDIYNEQSLSAQGFNVSLTANGPAAFAATDNIHAQRRDEALDRVHGNTQEQKDKDRAAMMQAAELARRAHDQFMATTNEALELYDDGIDRLDKLEERLAPIVDKIENTTSINTLNDGTEVFINEDGKFVTFDENGSEIVITDLEKQEEARRNIEEMKANGEVPRDSRQQEAVSLLTEIRYKKDNYWLYKDEIETLQQNADKLTAKELQERGKEIGKQAGGVDQEVGKLEARTEALIAEKNLEQKNNFSADVANTNALDKQDRNEALTGEEELFAFGDSGELNFDVSSKDEEPHQRASIEQEKEPTLTKAFSAAHDGKVPEHTEHSTIASNAPTATLGLNA